MSEKRSKNTEAQQKRNVNVPLHTNQIWHSKSIVVLDLSRKKKTYFTRLIYIETSKISIVQWVGTSCIRNILLFR